MLVERQYGPVTYRFEARVPEPKPKRKRLRGDPGKCFYCGEQMTWDVGSPFQRTFDHKMPLVRGGEGGSNRVKACRWCNQDKGELTVDEYRDYVNYRDGTPGQLFFRERRPR